jgi:hypothetical protein
MTTMNNDEHHDQKNQPRKNTPKARIKCRSSSNEAFPREKMPPYLSINVGAGDAQICLQMQ